MDCRRTLVLAVALSAGIHGCASFNKGQTVAQKDSAADLAKSARRGSDRKPSPSFCVALGNMRMESAADPKRTPTERDRLYDEARQAYHRAVEIDPKYVPGHLALANYYDTVGQHPRAMECYHKAAKVSPKDGSVHFEQGMCHARHKEWDAALASLRQANELEPENRHFAKTYGFCLARAGRYQESMDHLKRHLGEAEAHHNLARMLHHMGQDAASRQHLYRALELDPQNGPAREMLAQLDAPPAPAAPDIQQVDYRQP